MFMAWLIFFLSFFGIYFLFRKKLLCLLMMELSFVALMFLYFFFSFNSFSDSSYFCLMLFLSFMVLDSVLGLCSLIASSRSSSPLYNPFFGK